MNTRVASYDWRMAHEGPVLDVDASVVWTGGFARSIDRDLMLKAARDRRPSSGEGVVEFPWIDYVVVARWQGGKAHVHAYLSLEK